MSSRIILAGMLPVAVVCLVEPASAQWVEQSLTLQEGWNAIQLEIDPVPKEADAIFDGLPIESVWMNRLGSLSSRQLTDCLGPDDANCRLANDTRWMVWVPADDPGRVAINLRIIRGGAYLIKATEATELTLVGPPSAAKTEYRDGFTLVGFHVVRSPASAASFADYLAPSSAHSATEVYVKGQDGELSRIAGLEGPIAYGAAYWVKADAGVTYDGPLTIDDGSLTGLVFGTTVDELGTMVSNLTSVSETLTMNLLATATPPDGRPGVLPSAGTPAAVWKSYSDGSLSGPVISWNAFPRVETLAAAGEPASSRDLITGVDREAMTQGAGLYQGLLQIQTSLGFERIVGISSEVPPQAGLWLGTVGIDRVAWETAGSAVLADADRGNDFENPQFAHSCRSAGGTYRSSVGTACTEPPCGVDGACCIPSQTAAPDCQVLDPFECAAMEGAYLGDGSTCASAGDVDTNSLRPTAATLTFPIIVHLSDEGAGQLTLLTEVALKFDPGDAGTSGKYVLVTPACPAGTCDDLEPGEIVNGEPFTRRIGSSGYAFDGDLSAEPGSSLESGMAFTIDLPMEHPLNPFRHKFNPDHDCSDPGECYDVTREMSFTFDQQPPAGETDPGFGFSTLGGDYLETMTLSFEQVVVSEDCGCNSQTSLCEGGPHDGMPCGTGSDGVCDCVLTIEHSYTTHAGGRFVIKRVSEIARLNDVQ